MIALIQRVAWARVEVAGRVVGAVERGLLALIGIRPDDDAATADRLLERVLGYRVFPDEAGRMNRSLTDVQGGLLLVPQFTLAADTRSGMRASFTTAAAPAVAAPLFAQLLAAARARHHGPVAGGEFGADMKVSLLNDGPVTFWLESGPGTDKGR
jgi:D-tyrosyl-tRNA(Tyr) deacylase